MRSKTLGIIKENSTEKSFESLDGEMLNNDSQITSERTKEVEDKAEDSNSDFEAFNISFDS